MEPLQGLRVVEFAIAVQGPFAGGFLADMGADVIKVEPPGGDPNRWHTGVNWDHPKQTPGAQFMSVSHGKRLDRGRHPHGRRAGRRLPAWWIRRTSS